MEKIFLLHEEFQKPANKIRVGRLSRHLYDIEKLMDTPSCINILHDNELYQHIVEHRKTITPLRGIDYSNHVPGKINPIPPEELTEEWKKDYNQMRGNMIYKESLTFEELIERIKILKTRIKQIKF